MLSTFSFKILNYLRMKYIQENSNEILDCPCGSGFENCDCQEYFYNPDECDICGCDPCNCFEDVCCYDPRYTGPLGSCHCRDHFQDMERENHWFFKHWDVLYYHHWRNIKHFFSSPIFKIKRYLYAKRTCCNCKKSSLYRKWNGLVCPICKEEDLPF
jgi:hypothetical protein